MRSFYLSIYEKQNFPSFRWTRSTNNTHGQLTAFVDYSMGPKPVSAFGYKARTLNDKRRDFRLVIGDPNHPGKAMANPVLWFTTAIDTKTQGQTITYTLTVANPLTGWEGLFIQVNFPGPDGTALELTTETLIIPDTYPTDDCVGAACIGTLV